MSDSPTIFHSRWVRTSHWIVTISFLLLAFTGIIIVMSHPRFYWGEVGNDLTPALFELPISRNYQHKGWENDEPFFAQPGSPVSAERTFVIFNQNGWGRSLHFLAAWFLVITGLTYFTFGILTGHFRRHLFPNRKEFSPVHLMTDVKNHLRLRVPAPSGGPHYGVLQKCTYALVVFFFLPLVVWTGLAMSPRINAAFPFLSGIFGGTQSARTIHFFGSSFLVIFMIIHIFMISRSGFKQHMLDMTIGKRK